MVQKDIRDFNSVQYSTEESAEMLKELLDRTVSDKDGYNSIDELAIKVNNLVKTTGNLGFKPFGYDLIKGNGNGDEGSVEIGDELKRIGTLFPGFWVHLFVKSVPIDGGDPTNSVVVLNSAFIQ